MLNTFFFVAVFVLAVIGAATLLWPQRVKSDFDISEWEEEFYCDQKSEN